MLNEKNMYKFRKDNKAMRLKNNFPLTCFNLLSIELGTMDNRDTRWRSWLRHCATSQKVAGSIPRGVIGILQWHNPSGHTMALGLIQPLTEIRTRNISCACGWQSYHLHVPNVLKSGSLNLLEPSGPVMGLLLLWTTGDENVKL